MSTPGPGGAGGAAEIRTPAGRRRPAVRILPLVMAAVVVVLGGVYFA